ncbi:MAG: LysR family transcriptional regulator [Jannaschia helgolandensis]|uniref:Transcriptional regulator, LysR family n=1 Tax=Jannaschia helgolandensis TaxID=188906 RepID=A0A1H7PYF0_9RHOB|nr:LysR family transcriptional regulator [Jannaschia helgolandensis]SEL40850.1 transcriptional regulator, LysR family [Jannaschia helgolandensis]
MIDHLKHMAVFARVVDKGSFRAAAQDIGVAPSRVSQTITDLENHLGTTLLYRTTRKLALTGEGRALYMHVTQMLRSAEAGLNEINATMQDPVGALRVSIPAFLSTSDLSTAMAAFIKRYPNVALSLFYSDRRVEIIENGLDLAIKAGSLSDSAMMSRKLGIIPRALVAGAEYASARPVPSRPADMEDWDWIRYQQRSDTIELTSDKGETESVTGRSQIEVDSANALYHFAMQDVGASVLPENLAARGVASGSLVRLLPKWRLGDIDLHAVWPDSSRRETLTLLFVRFLADALGR